MSMNKFRQLAARIDQQMQQLAEVVVSEAHDDTCPNWIESGSTHPTSNLDLPLQNRSPKPR